MKPFDLSDYNFAARAYWWFVTITGVCLVVWSLFTAATNWTPAQVLQCLALGGFVALSSRQPIRIPNMRDSFTMADCFVFVGAIFLGVPAAVILGALDSGVSSLRDSRRLTTLLIASSVSAVSVFISSNIFYVTLKANAGFTTQPLGTNSIAVGALMIALAAMALTQYVANTWLVAGLHALKNRRSIWKFWHESFLWTSFSFFAAAVAAGFIYYSIMHLGWSFVLVGVGIVAATIASYKVYFERVNEKTREAAEMSRLHLATVEALATAIDAKDQMTHFHVRRVQLYCEEMGKLFNLSDAEIKALRAGALLHDIGKLAVPDQILNKPGELTSAEFDRMKIHTRVGAQILERVNFPYPVIPIVLHHHERWDGRGYPDGLSGENIPLTARILAVVDAFDTVREERPYRRALSRKEASELLRRGAATHFDPSIVKTFLERLNRFDEAIIAADLDCYGAMTDCGDIRELVAGEVTQLNAEENAKVKSINLVDPRDSHADARALNRSPQPLIRGTGVTQHLPSASNVLGGKRVVSHSSQTTRTTPAAPSYLNQIRDAHREAHALYEIARTFGSSLDLQDIVTIIVNKVGNVVHFDTCAVYIYDEAKATATVAHAAGRHSDLLRERIINVGDGLTGFVLANRRAVKGTNGRFDPMLDWAGIELPNNERFETVMSLPLIRGEKVLGALAIYSFTPEAYTDDHVRLLETITRLASDALSNAMNHAEMESNALTDSLTGLPNARALQLRFDEEAALARREGNSFQLVMLDLDDFKQVNDTFGHKIGDAVLREVSTLLASHMREYDFLARYAGDEFIAIVRNVDIVQLLDLRRRIERAIYNFRLRVQGDETAQVGISIGAARFPSDGDTLDNLIIAADAAMYSQKSDHKAGRHAHEPTVALDTSELASTAVN